MCDSKEGRRYNILVKEPYIPWLWKSRFPLIFVIDWDHKSPNLNWSLWAPLSEQQFSNFLPSDSMLSIKKNNGRLDGEALDLLNGKQWDPPTYLVYTACDYLSPTVLMSSTNREVCFHGQFTSNNVSLYSCKEDQKGFGILRNKIKFAN